MAYKWGDPNHLVSGVILQVVNKLLRNSVGKSSVAIPVAISYTAKAVQSPPKSQTK